MYKKRIIMAYIEFENVKKEYQTAERKRKYHRPDDTGGRLYRAGQPAGCR